MSLWQSKGVSTTPHSKHYQLLQFIRSGPALCLKTREHVYQIGWKGTTFQGVNLDLCLTRVLKGSASWTLPMNPNL